MSCNLSICRIKHYANRATNIKIADLVKDQETLHQARATALEILESDPNLALPQNVPIQKFLEFTNKNARVWSKIS